MQEIADPWNSESRIAVGQALMGNDGAPMTAAEIATESGRDPSNIRRTADGLVDLGVLELREPPTPKGGKPGPRTKNNYAFAHGAREAFEATHGLEAEPGTLVAGDQLIFLDAREPGADLLGCLANATISARIHWAAVCDGGDQELMIAVRGPNAVNASLDLMGAFKAAKLRARRVSIAKVDSAAALATWASRSARHIERSLRDTRP
jgi:hypothetical protein